MISRFISFLLLEPYFKRAKQGLVVCSLRFDRAAFSAVILHTLQVLFIKLQEIGCGVFIKFVWVDLKLCIVWNWFYLWLGGGKILDDLCVRFERASGANQPEEPLILKVVAGRQIPKFRDIVRVAPNERASCTTILKLRQCQLNKLCEIFFRCHELLALVAIRLRPFHHVRWLT